LIKTLLPLNLQDSKTLEDKFNICQVNNFKNNQNTPYICPGCGSSVDCTDVKCSFCSIKILFCYKIFEVITENKLWQCSFCDCTFSVNVVPNASQKCFYCNNLSLLIRTISGTKIYTPLAAVTPPLSPLTRKIIPEKSPSFPVLQYDFSQFQESTFDIVPSFVPSSNSTQPIENTQFNPTFPTSFPPDNTSHSSDPFPKKKTKKEKKEKKGEKGEKKLQKSKSSNDSSFVFLPPESIDKEKISKKEKKKYKEMFKIADSNHDGFIDGVEAKQFFLNCGLSKKNLSLIWRLSDLDQDSKLNLDEFRIAMHFVMCSLKGIEIPGTLPPSLIPKKKKLKQKKDETDSKLSKK